MKAATKALILLIALLPASISARNPFAAAKKMLSGNASDSIPYDAIAVHNVGKLALTITNYGVIGRGSEDALQDPLTGLNAPSLSYPKGFGLNYLFEGSLWVGAVVGHDTLVSTAGRAYWDINEFWPTYYSDTMGGDIQYRSTLNVEAPEYKRAVSQQDFIAMYTDTLTNPKYVDFDYYSGRFHRPLNVRITQKSYAWGYDYAEDFVIFDCEIASLNYYQELKDVYIGIYMDNDIGRDYREGGYDDICGFKKSVPSRYIGGLVDTINIAWAADNNGDPDPVSGDFLGLYSPTGIVATRLLRTPLDSLYFNFNWWISSFRQDWDWGPRRAGTPEDPFRSFDGYLGTPVGDKNKYYMLSHKEFDYDQIETYLDHTSSGWLPPPVNADRISYGDDIRYLLSFGPFQLGPGDKAPFTFAVVMGQNFHAGYRFDDVGLNALWAGWIFDNPGVDTDGDGYKGKYHIYTNPDFSDTIYYEGDGYPDFKGAAPPPSPVVRLYPGLDEINHGEIKIRWNGRLSETTNDQFSQKVDFEGYRVYISLTGRPDEFTLVTSYDIENYDRWEYDGYYKRWQIINPPYKTQQLKWMYGDSFDPEKYYSVDHLFTHFNWGTQKYEVFYFTQHDWNVSNYFDTTQIHKIYPDQPYPSSLDMDSIRTYFPNELTEQGELKYFEYGYTLKNLLPSQQYYVSVTAFDQGFPGKKLPPLETQPQTNAQREFALNSSQLSIDKGLDVVVYPNPYRIDGRYRERFEGWERPDLSVERNRAIHFTNLPNKCTIRIFSIDGDLIREIRHDYPANSAGSMHESWDLITRNTMAVTSGIYYFSVESELGNYIGKFVIIK